MKKIKITIEITPTNLNSMLDYIEDFSLDVDKKTLHRIKIYVAETLAGLALDRYDNFGASQLCPWISKRVAEKFNLEPL